MRTRLLFFLIFTSLSPSVFAQQLAYTWDSTQVILSRNGTWKYNSEIKIHAPLIPMPTPNYEGLISSDTNTTNAIELKRISSVRGTVWEKEWFSQNDISLNGILNVPNYLKDKGKLPIATPMHYQGSSLLRFIRDSTYNYLVYGTNFNNGVYLVITSNTFDSVYFAFDFREYKLAPNNNQDNIRFVEQGIQWVKIHNRLLYISHFHRTYSESSGGQNGYISCINLIDKSVVWTTKPLTCNSVNFEIVDEVIISGYGFTDEDDFILTVDIRTGEVLKKLPLRFMATYIIRKDNLLYVRSYAKDYVFELK